MQPMIQIVLHTYGVYDASLERAFIRAHQKPAPPLPMATTLPSNDGRLRRDVVQSRRIRVCAVLRASGVWMTVSDVAGELGVVPKQIDYTLSQLASCGQVQRERQIGQRMQVQRYRWSRT
jgi:hypothetical protein